MNLCMSKGGAEITSRSIRQQGTRDSPEQLYYHATPFKVKHSGPNVSDAMKA
jgi:hypothetical protein